MTVIFMNRHDEFMQTCQLCRFYLERGPYTPRCSHSQEKEPPLCYIERIDPARCGQEAIHFQPCEKEPSSLTPA